MHKDPLANYKNHQRDKYMFNPELKYYGSMFFWYYTILCFSDFQTLLLKNSKELKKKIDTKVLLALQLVKFTSEHNPKLTPISYKDLLIIWWLTFDQNSYRNEELREVLKWTEWEYILEVNTPTSYDVFFKDIESKGIEKPSFNKYHRYLPKKMFFDAIALVLKCDKHEWTKPDNLWDNEILWHRWGLYIKPFQYAVTYFIKKPKKKIERGEESFPFYSSENWLMLCETHQKAFKKKLGWDEDLGIKYARQTNLSDEKWMSAMEPLLKWIMERKIERNKIFESEWINISIKWTPPTSILPN